MNSIIFYSYQLHLSSSSLQPLQLSALIFYNSVPLNPIIIVLTHVYHNSFLALYPWPYSFDTTFYVTFYHAFRLAIVSQQAPTILFLLALILCQCSCFSSFPFNTSSSVILSFRRTFKHFAISPHFKSLQFSFIFSTDCSNFTTTYGHILHAYIFKVSSLP